MKLETLVNKLLDLGFTQVELAENLGVSQATINRLRCGTVKNPKINVTQHLQKIYNLVELYQDNSLASIVQHLACR